MTDTESAAFVPFEAELAAMHRAVVCRAQAGEILEGVGSAFGAELDVVDIHPACMGATGYLAAMLIAQQHGAAPGGRDGLPGPRASATLN
jgi:hypothetical protein